MRLTHADKGFTRNEGEVVLNGFRGGTGTILYKFHTHRGGFRGPGQDNTPLAQAVFLEKPAPTVYLQNLALPGMKVRNQKAGQIGFQSVPLNAKVQLSTGLEVQFGPEPESRLGAVEAFHIP